MKRIAVFLLVLLCFFSVPVLAESTDTGKCAPATFNGHSYKVFYEQSSWKEAQNKCLSEGGHLATITSKEENNFIKSLNISTYAWIGGYGTDTTWLWITEEKWGFTHWAKTKQASSKEAIYIDPNGYWYSVTTAMYRAYICEWDKINTTEYHDYKATDNYAKFDKDTHSIIYTCSNCNTATTYVSEAHTWKFKDTTQFDENCHHNNYECTFCGETKFEDASHSWNNLISTITKNSPEYHSRNYKCSVCDAILSVNEAHDWVNTHKYKKIDGNHHGEIYKCTICNETKIVKDTHKWVKEDNSFYKIDNLYHSLASYYCPDCDATKREGKVKHNLEYDRYIKEATLNSKGIVKYHCDGCGCNVNKNVSWKYGTDYSATYEPWFPYIYRSSRSVRVDFDHEAKGAVVKLKIGKKTYKKTIKNSKKTIKFKIKKPSYGKTIKATIYYKGRLIGKSGTDNVLYAKKIKKGMTKKQVLYTKGWGYPNNKGTYSNGWTYWYYGDGAFVGFKNGKVKSWYK